MEKANLFSKQTHAPISGMNKALIMNQTYVSTTLATHLFSKKLSESNVVFSPFSIHVVLSLLAAGSKGRTQDQLLTFLTVNKSSDLNSLYAWLTSFIFDDGSPNAGPRLSVANGVWVDKTLSLNASFKEVVDTIYKATCKQVDFLKPDEVADEVNLWAEKQTNGLIKGVINPRRMKKSTKLICANAVYFKGAWMEEYFNKSSTRDLDFHLLDGNKVKIPFMTSYRRQNVCEYNDFKVLGLPYFQGPDKRQFTMYFFLPDANDGLQYLVQKISSTPEFLNNHIRRKNVDIGKFFIPKFKISTEFEVSDMLKKLGLVLPFEDVDDFNEMVDLPTGETLYVSSFHQKTFVEVNEEGTKAASVSPEFEILGSVAPAYKVYVDFVADHPFLFVIREDVSGVVLFMGCVINPTVG